MPIFILTRVARPLFMATALSLICSAAEAGTAKRKSPPVKSPEVRLQETTSQAQSDDPKAQFALADMYENGIGTPKNIDRAVFWYTKAALKNEMQAQIRLGEIYGGNAGMDRNDVLTAYWRMRAADTKAGEESKKLNDEIRKTHPQKDESGDSHVEDTSLIAPKMMADSCKKPEYPAASLRNEEEGTVIVLLAIDENGKVLDASISRSSGFRKLDLAARNAISLCSFTPATFNGQPIPSLSSIQFKWSLN